MGELTPPGLTHQIITFGPPTVARPCRLSGERHQVARQAFEDVLELGTIRLYNSS